MSVVAKGYWEKIYASRAWGQYPPEELVRFMARNFRTVANQSEVRVLEIGCGPGPNIWYLVREGFSVAGIDGSPTAIKQAEERLIADELPHIKPHVDLKVGNFSSLPWADESFNAVIDLEALYANLMADIKLTVMEIYRTLKPNGLFFGKMFGTETMGSNSGKMLETGTMHSPETGPCLGNETAHFFTRDEINDLFSGFCDISIDQVNRTDHNGTIKISEWLVTVRK